MAGEAANSSAQGPAADQNLNSVEAAIESGVDFGGAESTCNNSNIMSNGESSAAVSGVEREKSLEYAEELMVRGSNAIKERDYAEATDCYSRALEIRVAHFGELAPECVNAYYMYGCALLRKAQEEADPLASMPKKEGVSQEDCDRDGSDPLASLPKKEGVSQEDCDKDGSVKSSVNGESSATSVSTIEQEGSTNCLDEVTEVKNEEGEDESDAEDLADGDEDESDLDLAWKMLDVSRAIVEKHCGDTLEKVDILSALAEVALEREDVETSLSDYLKSLSILERLVQPDSRLIAELNFRVCLCLEIGSKPVEAVPYCQKAISVCKSRLQRLTNEVKICQGAAKTPSASESSELVPPSSDASHSCDPIADKESEIDTLTDLCDELEKKLEDLQQLASNPTSILSDILEMMSAKANAGEKSAVSVAMNSSQMGIAINTGGITESPTVSTAHSNNTPGITHLGVVGRGVKRVVVSSTTESGPTKKPSIDPSSNNSDGSAS